MWGHYYIIKIQNNCGKHLRHKNSSMNQMTCVYLIGMTTNVFQISYMHPKVYTDMVKWLHTVTKLTLWKWGHFDKAKPTFRMLLVSWNFDTIKRIRSFIAENLRSVGQRAAKLLTIKLWEWFDPARTRIRLTGSRGARAGWQTFLETSYFESQ